MADLTSVPAQVAPVGCEAEIVSFIAAAALSAGDPVYLTTAGKVNLADANGTAPAPQFKGIALQTVGAGQAVDVLKSGYVMASGLGASALAYGAKVYLSDTAGKLADGAGTTSVKVGEVMALADADLTKVVWIDAQWATGY